MSGDTCYFWSCNTFSTLIDYRILILILSIVDISAVLIDSVESSTCDLSP